MLKAILLTAALAGTAAHAQAGDPVAGKTVFARCGICHAVGPGAATKIGPSLNGVVGRKAATLAGYTYSPAMMKSGLVWTPKVLDGYLAAPAKLVPGTKMAFPGLPQAKDRADVTAYLATFDATGAPKKK